MIFGTSVASITLCQQFIPEMKILVVDDSTINNILLQSFLEDNNFRVITALNVPDAFDMLLKDDISLVLLDLMMPDLSGFDFLKQLKIRGIKVPVVVITANADVDCRDKALGLGAKAYLNKPIQFNELLDKIKNTIELV